MRTFANLEGRRGWLLLAVAVIFTLAVHLGAQDAAPSLVPGSSPESRAAGRLSRGTAVPSTPGNRIVIKQYALDFDGDRSLDMATIIERESSGQATYTVQLHLASGADQSVVVAAPPGGLQVEMHDMTGDKVPNDLILRPVLLQRLPTVLVNDGHDHFTVAVSADDPGSITAGRLLAPGENDGHGKCGLLSSGFRTGGVIHDDELFPQLKEISFASANRFFARDSEQSSSSGRAPPLREF